MNRAFEYVNRMGDVYYLQSKPGKSGHPKFSFTRKLTGEPVLQLPKGYEAREHPETGQAVIRQAKPSAIRPGEKLFLERAIREHTDDLLFIVDAEDRALIVYVSDMDADARLALMRQIMPMDAATTRGMKADMQARARHEKMMRFALVDAESRLFNLDRWCVLGGIDDWYPVEGNAPLSVLAEKYLRHLGQESFFDLM